jgi:copper chaperone CopZ
MQCTRCETALRAELGAVSGVEEVAVDLGTKTVVVRGHSLDDGMLRAAIDDAGYEAA